jgi:hypothetical protein
MLLIALGGSMLTLFSIPKAFDGDAAVRQRNALRSWAALDVAIVLFGDDDGVAEAAREFGAEHVPEIDRTELGTPLVSAAFERADGIARTPLLLYANADIVFFDDLVQSLRRIAYPRFLALGRRRDVRVASELGPAEAAALVPRAVLFTEYGIDWFAYPRGIPWAMPRFAVGRPGWDNWLIWRARQLSVPVVDATAVVTALHQEHGYAHVPGGPGSTWEGPEADANLALLGRRERRYGIYDATHVLTPRGVRRAWQPPYLKRRARRSVLLGPILRRADRYRTRS